MHNYESANRCTWSSCTSCSLSLFSISWYGVSQKAHKKSGEIPLPAASRQPPATRSCGIAPTYVRGAQLVAQEITTTLYHTTANTTPRSPSAPTRPLPSLPYHMGGREEGEAIYRPGSPKANCQQRAADRWKPLQLSPRAEKARAAEAQTRIPAYLLDSNMESALVKRSITTMEGSSWGDVGSINLPATEAAACSNMSGQGESALFVVPYILLLYRTRCKSHIGASSIAMVN